jgi:hypothetical protein
MARIDLAIGGATVLRNRTAEFHRSLNEGHSRKDRVFRHRNEAFNLPVFLGKTRTRHDQDRQ